MTSCAPFEAEQAARRKAEELLAKSTESEASLKGQLEAEVKKRSKEQKQLAAERDEVCLCTHRLLDAHMPDWATPCMQSMTPSSNKA